jgi:hypothetical protein
VTKNFEVQWKAVKDKNEEDTPDVPKIMKTLPIMNWTEAFTDFLDRVIGVRTIPLCCVIREEVQVKEWQENKPDAVKRGKQEKVKGKEDKKRLHSKKEIVSLVSKKVKLARGEKGQC